MQALLKLKSLIYVFQNLINILQLLWKHEKHYIKKIILRNNKAGRLLLLTSKFNVKIKVPMSLETLHLKRPQCQVVKHQRNQCTDPG